MADGFRIAKAFVQVDPNTEGFKEKLQAALDEAVADARASVPVDADISDLEAKLDQAKEKLDQLRGEGGSVRLDGDAADLDAKLDEIRGKLDELDGKEAKPVIGLDSADFDAKSEDAAGKLDELDGRHADPKLGLDTTEFDAALADAQAKLEAFQSQSASVNLGSSGGSGSSSGLGGGESGGGLLGGLTGGLAMMMPGIGGAATGMGLLAGTGALGLTGVFKAVSAAHQAAIAIGMTQQQLAATEFSNSVQIQQAQVAVGQAHLQAAQDAANSAQQIEQSQMTLAQTERNAAMSIAQAQQQSVAAAHGLMDAQFAQRMAQYNLTQAWEQARITLQQLNNAEQDAALNVKQAALAIKEAQYQQMLVDQNAYSTSLDRQQAALSVAQAEQQLTDAKTAQTSAQYQANLVNKQGVAGQQQVLMAQQALRDAIYGVSAAQKQVQLSNMSLRDTMLNNADAIKSAQLQVAAAERNASFQQQRDAIAVRQAQLNLTNTYKQQKLQMAAMWASANQAALMFQKDMGRLTPAGRSVVRTILSMRGAFHRLLATAQNSVAPGIKQFLFGIRDLMPTITAGVREMGGAMSHAFGLFGKQMQTPWFARTMRSLLDEGTRFTNIVLPAFAQFIQELAIMGSKQGAVSGLANLLAGLARGLTGMASTLAAFEPALNQILTLLGNILGAAGPQLGLLIGTFAKVLEPITSFLNGPGGRPFVQLLAMVVSGMLAWKMASFAVIGPMKALLEMPGKLAKGLTDLGKLPGKIAEDFGKLGKAARSFGSGVGSMFSKIGSTASKVWGGIANVASSTWSKVTTVATSAWGGISRAASATWSGVSSAATTAFGAVRSGIQAVPGMLSAAASNVGSFISGLKDLAITQRLVAAAQAVWNGVTLAFNAIMDAGPLVLIPLIVAAIAGLVAGVVYAYNHFTWFRDGVQGAFKIIETAALWLWHNVFDPFWHGIAHGAEWLYRNGIEPYFTLIRSEFTLLEDAALWMWHNVFDPLWQGIRSGAATFVAGFRSIWNTLDAVFKNPVNFLIGTVYDRGIARLWNDVVGALGMNSIKLPIIPMMAGGGIVPGKDHGRDEKLVMMRPEEGVLVPGAVHMIGGPPAIHALNEAASGRRSGPSRGTIPGFANGGVLGSITNALSGVGNALVGGAKLAAELAINPLGALSSLMRPVIGTTATGELGRMMLGIPTDLVKQLARAFMSTSGTGNVSPGHVTGTIAQWFAQAVKMTGVGNGWIPDLETIARYESAFNPQAINLTDSNAAAGDPSRGIMQMIMSTFLAYHQAGTSMNIFDPIANIASAIRYIKARYGTVGDVPGIVSLSHGGGYVGYDSGGWMMPAGSMPGTPVNLTGKPEAVLTPEESQAFVRIARTLTQHGVGGLGGATVVQNFNGTAWPNPEQQAAMKREMALALAGP